MTLTFKDVTSIVNFVSIDVLNNSLVNLGNFCKKTHSRVGQYGQTVASRQTEDLVFACASLAT